MSRPQQVRRTASPTLADLRAGEQVRVESVDDQVDPVVGRRLVDLGLVPGTLVEVVRHAPLRDPIAFRFRDTTMCLRRAQARLVRVSRA